MVVTWYSQMFLAMHIMLLAISTDVSSDSCNVPCFPFLQFLQFAISTLCCRNCRLQDSIQCRRRRVNRQGAARGSLPPHSTSHGKSWTVKSKQVILPRQIGGTRVHVMTRAEIKRSGISYAGNSRRILGAGYILAEYEGEIISIYDAEILQMQVSALHCPAFHQIYREPMSCELQFSLISFC
jgi:hypothetical protein